MRANAELFQGKYQSGYGLAYPESHLIRVHKNILVYELHMLSGRIFDFGCGSGAHLQYFADHSFIPFGCDTSPVAIAQCRERMPAYRNHFFVTEVRTDITKLVPKTPMDIFLSNQVLYYLTDPDIREVTRQAYQILRKQGVFIATMMSPSCFYHRFVSGSRNSLKKVELSTPREKDTMYINFKKAEELAGLFAPFRKLHLGSYGSHIREEEGLTDHWLYVGIKD